MRAVTILQDVIEDKRSSTQYRLQHIPANSWLVLTSNGRSHQPLINQQALNGASGLVSLMKLLYLTMGLSSHGGMDRGGLHEKDIAADV